MSIEFPLFTVVFLTAFVAIFVTGLWLTWVQVMKRAPLANAVKTGSLVVGAIILALWALIRALQLPSEDLSAVTASMVGFIVAGVVLPVLPLILWPAFRQGLRTLPQTWMPRLNAVRLTEGFVFLALYDMRLLPAAFAVPAGLGDMAAGLLGLFAGWALSRQKPYAMAAAIAWNVLGLADFVTALVTGGMFLGPFAQAAAPGASLHYLNYVLLIPSLGVPALLSLHLYSLVQLLSRKTRQAAESPGQPMPSVARA